MTYDQGKGFIGNEFIKYKIETEYGITAKPRTLVNPMSNAVLESIHQVLGNLVRIFSISTQTYIDEDDPWTGTLSSAEFSVQSTTNNKNGYSPEQ